MSSLMLFWQKLAWFAYYVIDILISVSWIIIIIIIIYSIRVFHLSISW